MNSFQNAKKAKNYIVDPIEKKISGVGDKIANYTIDETKTSMRALWKQLLGGEDASTTLSQGTMLAGKEISFKQGGDREKIAREARPAVRAAYNYTDEILKTGEKGKRESREIIYKLNGIIDEIKRLATASTVLEKEITEATGQTIVNPGKYHLNFFEWLLIEIRQARIQVEDASSWAATLGSKHGKRQKSGYWNKYKEQGTKFGLSGERSVSTQTG